MSDPRDVWRARKPELLQELETMGQAWDIQTGLRFDLNLAISEGVPICRVVCGDVILVAGALS